MWDWRIALLGGVWILGTAAAEDSAPALPYRVVDTGQIRAYDNRTEIRFPAPGAAFFGQDAQYSGNQPSYRDNGDGTVTDLNTGLMWQADPGSKKSYAEAVAGAEDCRSGGHSDWRLPSIKELYSLILFSGTDPDPSSRDSSRQKPFIDTDYFKFQYGKPSDGDRIIDSQWATSTLYVGKVMNGAQAMFGVNFADGRIKGYPTGRDPRGRTKDYYVLYVRGNTSYGKNDFVDNGDGTVTDRATGSAAIDPVFEATPIKNEGGKTDYGQYWTSTSHTKVSSARGAVYIAFGRALGFMSRRGPGGGEKKLMDVHGAGAQRADVKSGNPSRFPTGRGPQGDVMRIYNLVRCVRGGTAEPQGTGPDKDDHLGIGGAR